MSRTIAIAGLGSDWSRVDLHARLGVPGIMVFGTVTGIVRGVIAAANRTAA